MNRMHMKKLALLVIAIFTMGLSANFAQEYPPQQPGQNQEEQQGPGQQKKLSIIKKRLPISSNYHKNNQLIAL